METIARPVERRIEKGELSNGDYCSGIVKPRKRRRVHSPSFNDGIIKATNEIGRLFVKKYRLAPSWRWRGLDACPVRACHRVEKVTIRQRKAGWRPLKSMPRLKSAALALGLALKKAAGQAARSASWLKPAICIMAS